MDKQIKKTLVDKCNLLIEAELHGLIESNENITTCSNNTTTNELTLEKVLEAKELLESVKEPFGEYMRKNGFDPDKGDILVIPEKNIAEVGGLHSLPSYVKVSKMLDSVFLAKNPLPGFKDIKLEPFKYNPPKGMLFHRINYSTYFDDRMIHFRTYKGQKIYRTMWHFSYIYKATWYYGKRSQCCASLDQAKKIIDIAKFFSDKIYEVKL